MTRRTDTIATAVFVLATLIGSAVSRIILGRKK